ncbi:MAG: M20 family metallopeptidase [Candidatus Limnocylindrales bacterium]
MAKDDADLGLGRLQALAELELPAYLSDLEALVGIDSGSYTKAGVDRVGRWMADALRDLGAVVRVEPNRELGDTVVGALHGRGRGRILVIGHLDTVFDPGTAASRPFRVAGGRAYGPGVCDMKAGLLSGIHALRVLRASASSQLPWLPCATLTFVANPDEEIGSPASTPIIRALAAEHDAALVLESARANGDIVSARKGNLSAALILHGRSAHAGVEPEKGRSAILEAAHKIVALHGLNGRWPGVTCNVGVVRGGTRANVVAEEAVLEVDLRSPTRADLESAEAAVRQIAAAATVPDVTCDLTIRGRHWPMERLPVTEALAGAAARIAEGLGFPLQDAATGGASDANTTAGEGVPSLDGLGPVGGLDHSPDEYIEVNSIVPRMALLAALLRAIGSGMIPGLRLRDAAGGPR